MLAGIIPTAFLNLAMLDLGAYLKDKKYTNYAIDHVAFGFANYKTFEQRFKHNVPHYTYPFGEFFYDAGTG